MSIEKNAACAHFCSDQKMYIGWNKQTYNCSKQNVCTTSLNESAVNSCTVQWSTTAVHVYAEYTELFSLANCKIIGDKMHMEDCQPSSWIKGSTSLPELFLSVNSAKPPSTKSSPPSTARRRSSRHLLEDSLESRCLDQEDAPVEMARYEPYCHPWTTAPVL